MNQHLGYNNPRRLADVMALIQVLSLCEDTKRSENGLQNELQRVPMTANSWTALATSHAEFFRVRTEDEGNLEAHRISMVARAVMPKRAGQNRRDPLPSDLIGKLLDIAITLHDREIARRDAWKTFVPVAAAIIAGLFAVAAAVFKLDGPNTGKSSNLATPPPALAPPKSP
jgi:hypothetical protein